MSASPITVTLLALGVALAGLGVHRVWRQRARLAFIRQYRFHPDTLAALDDAWAQTPNRALEMAPTAGLSPAQRDRVAQALRSYFLVHAQAPRALAGMPSKAADALWHAFILDTRAYHAFCRRAFGAYFHHVPASRMRPGVGREAGLRLTWRLACRQEGINPARPTRLPLLFRIDTAVGWPNGNTFSLDRLRQPPAADANGSGFGGYACSGDGLVGDGPQSSTSAGDGADGGCSGGCGGD